MSANAAALVATAEARWPIESWQRLAHSFVLVLFQPAVPLAVIVISGVLGDDGVRPIGFGACARGLLGGGLVLALVVGGGLVAPGRVSPAALGWRRESFARVLALGLPAAVLCGGAVLLSIALAGGDVGAGLRKIAHYTVEQRALFLGMAVLISVFEESVFRGYLQPALVARLGLWGGIAATAAVFALYHPPRFFSWPSLLNRIIQGLIYGILRGRDRSLWTPAAAHAIYWATVGLL